MNKVIGQQVGLSQERKVTWLPKSTFSNTVSCPRKSHGGLYYISQLSCVLRCASANRGIETHEERAFIAQKETTTLVLGHLAVQLNVVPVH